MDGLMELPGMAFEELASSGPRSLFGTSSEASLHPPASALCGLEITANCLHGSTLDPDSLESTLHQSAVEGAFTYESMDAPSPEINEIHEPSPETAFSMGMSSLQAYASAAFENSNSGSADPNLFADPSKDAATAAAMSTAAVVDGTQSASAAPQSLDSAEMYSIEQQSAQPSSSGPDSGIVPDTPQPTSALPNSDASERKIVRKKRFFTIRDFEGLALPSISEIRDMQETQKMYVHSQMEELHRLLRVQHKLTGVNPLSQELNTWVLGLKAVKKTEESLSQEALAMLRNVYAIKDIVTKKEAFELSVLTGSTQTQVRDFFAAQQSRVKKILKNSEEEMGRTGGRNAVEQSHVQSSAMDAATSNRSNSADSFEKLLDLMRSENSFTGQTRLLQIILQAEPGPMLRLFLDKGGLRIISKWLVQAAVEEQTSLIRQLLKALVHLPMIHAIPGQVSPIVQTVNRLRTYFAADVGNQARSLLMSWTKLYARTKVTRILSALIDPPLVQKEKAVESDKQNSSGVSQPDQKKMKIEKSSADSTKVSAVGKPQGLTNKVIANDKSGKPILNTLRRSIQTIEDPGLTNPNPKKRLAPDHGKERRQVVLVDDGTNKRVSEGRRSVDKSSRPLSADDIQKAKMRARLLQGSTSKPRASDTPQLQNQSSQLPPPPPPPPPIVPSSSLRRYVLPEATVTATSSSSAAAATTTTAAATASAAKSGYYSDEKLRLGTTGIEMSRTGAGGQLQANPILLSTALEGLLPFLTSQANANANVDDNTKIPSFPANTQNVNIEQRITEVGVAAAVGDREDGQKLVEQEEKEGKEKEEEEEAKQRKEEAVVAVAVVDASSELPVRVIPWALPPEIRSDALWSVAGGEDSKEREIQTLRVKREEEEFYSHPSFIPLNPKDPWDEEQEYDDSLTLVVPLESQKDDDVDGGGGDGGDVKNIRSHDPQLLALLLSNPTLVSHLSSKDAAAQQRRSADVSYAQGQGHHHQQQQQQHLHSLPLPSLSLPLPSAAHHQFATSAYASQYIPQQQQEYRDWGNRLPPQQQQQQQQQHHPPPHHQYGQYQQQPHQQQQQQQQQQQSWFNPSMVPPNWRAP